MICQIAHFGYKGSSRVATRGASVPQKVLICRKFEEIPKKLGTRAQKFRHCLWKEILSTG